MTSTPNWLERTRIERVVWTVDLLLQDLPGGSRRTVRRELRANLHAAHAEVGTTAALRRLGGLRHLAAEYLDAEYGDRNRPRWRSGLAWTVTVWAFLLAVGFAGQTAFVDGVLEADPTADGTFAWSGFLPGGISGDVSLERGQANAFSFTFPMATVLYLLGAFLLGSRSWRLWRPKQRRRTSR